MLIGVMSDTHDNVPLIEKAVALFNDRKVGFVIHAGDYVAPFALIIILVFGPKRFVRESSATQNARA